MHVQILLETPYQAFTNLDVIKGKIILKIPTTVPLTSIAAKLEGESTTQLTPAPRDDYDDRPKPVLEIHKVLYQVQMVFPRSGEVSSSKTFYTLPPGQHEFPFSFKVPFNSACENTMASLQTLPNLLSKGKINSSNHIKAALPPTLGGFPGLASVRYYVKCTVNRKEFYKENPRITQQINFIPLETPRPPPSDSESFGRRTYEFSRLMMNSGGVPQPKMKRVFSNLSLSKKSSTSAEMSDSKEHIPPKVKVDARLPDPAILTLNKSIPLRLLVTRIDEGTLPLYLNTLQVELVGHTNVRAGQVTHRESSSWVITSRSNLNQYLEFKETVPNVPLREVADRSKEDEPPLTDRKASTTTIPATESKEKAPNESLISEKAASQTQPVPYRQIVLDATPWKQPIPQTVAPSFETCNISREYDLEARIGIGYGPQSVKNQIVLPLRLPCKVKSGIMPSPALIAAMKQNPKTMSKKPVTKKPLSAEAAANVANHQAQAQSETDFAPLPPGEVEPPPSYEDAMANNLGPVDGPRNYQPPPAPAEGDGFTREKH